MVTGSSNKQNASYSLGLQWWAKGLSSSNFDPANDLLLISWKLCAALQRQKRLPCFNWVLMRVGVRKLDSELRLYNQTSIVRVDDLLLSMGWRISFFSFKVCQIQRRFRYLRVWLKKMDFTLLRVSCQKWLQPVRLVSKKYPDIYI